MNKLTLDSKFKKGKYAGKSVSDLVKIPGKIFSMIKEGYCFDDEILDLSNISKKNRDVTFTCSVNTHKNFEDNSKKLSVDKKTVKQILSEINTLNNLGNNIQETESEVDNIILNDFKDEDE